LPRFYRISLVDCSYICVGNSLGCFFFSFTSTCGCLSVPVIFII
jgi:hypothetical protein